MDAAFALNTIYIVRHGIAEDANFRQPDAERQLTDKGRERMHEIGNRMKAMDVTPSLIIASPYVRAIQTATILAEKLQYTNDIIQDNRITPMGRYENFCDLYFEFRSSQHIMFVGHEPSASDFVSRICADGKLHMDFKKGAVCAIAIERMRPVQGSMLWYATPSVLRA